jgi:glycosyltransferase involved in cell wall biosynthesis
VIAGLDVGGAETMLAGLVGARPPALEQTVISLIPGGALEARIAAAGVPVATLGMRRGRPSIGGFLRLVRLIRAQRPDVLQSWMYHADLASTLALSVGFRRGTVRHAWNLRCSDMDSAQYGRLFRAVRAAWMALAPRADLLIANSASGLDFHRRQGMRGAKTLVIPNGIDTARFRPDAEARARLRKALGIAPERQLVALVARVDPMKDHAGFLAALQDLPEVSALLIGRGTEALDAAPGIVRLGERPDVPDLLAAADLVVNSSAYGEGFSNALAEGMAAGLPAAATDVGDARQILGDTGVLCPPRDPAALARAIRQLLGEDHALQHRRAVAARQRIVEHFSLEACVARFAAAYREMVDIR